MKAPRFAMLLVALVLALSGVAHAQGAGDNQYQDPFAGKGGGGQTKGGGGSGSSGSSSGSSSSSSGSSSSSSGSSSQQFSGSPPGMSSSASGRIPRTGAEPITVALLGMGLVLAGVGLRLRVRRPVG
jgi:hypothetical protein